MINLQNKTEQSQAQVAEPAITQTPQENFSLAECRQGYIDDFEKTGELEKYTARLRSLIPIVLLSLVQKRPKKSPNQPTLFSME